MDERRVARLSCFVVLLASFLLPVYSQAAQAKDSSNILFLLPAVIREGGGTCASGPQTVNFGGLEWQRCDDGKVYNRDAAIDYCENLTLAGHSDWHLPSLNQLKSLVVCTNGTPTPLNTYMDGPEITEPPTTCDDGNDREYRSPPIDGIFECITDRYISKDVPDYSHDGCAWVVNFFNGYASHHIYILDPCEYLTRCIR